MNSTFSDIEQSPTLSHAGGAALLTIGGRLPHEVGPTKAVCFTLSCEQALALSSALTFALVHGPSLRPVRRPAGDIYLAVHTTRDGRIVLGAATTTAAV